MFCENCGQPVNEGVAFCENCGNLIEAKEPTKQTYTATAVNPDARQTASQPYIRKGKKVANIQNIIIVALVIIIAVGGFFLWHTKQISAMEDENSTLIGMWENEGDGYLNFVEFFSDGTTSFEHAGNKIEWKTDKDQLIFSGTMMDDSYTETFGYKIFGSTLTLTPPDGDKQIFNKITEARKQTLIIKANIRANESGAVGGLRGIGSAQVSYSIMNGNYASSISQLIANNNLDPQFSGSFNGYQYVPGTVTGAPSTGFVAGSANGYLAIPTNPGITGRYIFGLGADLVLRYMGKGAGLGADVPNPKCGNNDCNVGDPLGGWTLPQ